MEKVGYQDLVDSAVQQLQSGLHLERYGHQRQFVRVICDGAAKESLVACILEMVLAFLDMYRSHINGKGFAKMEQEWMRHIDDYLDSSKAETDEAPLMIRKERKRLWDKVTSAAAAVGPTLDRQGQRIIVSTLCCIVFDLMIETVKKYKLQHTNIEAASTSLATTDDRFQMRESKVSLY